MKGPVPGRPGAALLTWSVRGIPLLVSPSWLAALAATTLTFGLGMHVLVPTISVPAAGSLGLVLACALSGALVVHEFAHALVAEKAGIGIEHIKLFGGGALCLRRHSVQGPREQFSIAAAGPLASTALAAGAMALALALDLGRTNPIATAGLWLFAFTNMLIAATNLLPIFPFDGGKLLHSLLWRSGRDRRAATAGLERCGREFSRVVIALGLLCMAFGGELMIGVVVSIFGVYLLRLRAPPRES